MTPSPDVLQAKILIVDDKEANVLLLDRMLRGAGYISVTSTTDSSKVCELHLTNRYDLILLDLQMPGMDGFEVLENLKKIETSGYLPVLAITVEHEYKLRALKAGAKDFICKPFDLAEVLLRVHNMLEVRLLHLETKKLYERILAEQQVSKRLLRDVLPHALVERLESRPKPATESAIELISESYAEVTVVFSDILEFTKFSEGASADVLMGVLNACSTRFEGRAASPALDRSTILDDAYLAAVGLPDALANHSISAARMAVDLVKALDRFNAHSRYKLKVRISVDTSKMATDEKRKAKRKRKSNYDL